MPGINIWVGAHAKKIPVVAEVKIPRYAQSNPQEYANKQVSQMLNYDVCTIVETIVTPDKSKVIFSLQCDRYTPRRWTSFSVNTHEGEIIARAITTDDKSRRELENKLRAAGFRKAK